MLNDNLSGHPFIFRGRRGDTVKIFGLMLMVWCLFTKPEEGQFIWPAVRRQQGIHTRSQLAMLLDKLTGVSQKHPAVNSLTQRKLPDRIIKRS
ncbi:IS66 family insertion sequence element accessory protein TnpB [Escherichia coli]|uniref:IS66 family insertion sequence element accessory protein TnpB n=1 Tax=Escherichia coli TaxID=562 RepID=UPI003DA3AAF2